MAVILAGEMEGPNDGLVGIDIRVLVSTHIGGGMV